MPSDANTKGMFQLDDFPHAREWWDCCDDPDIEKITIQAATRIGKTLTSIGFMLKTGATNPHPMALADADEHSTRRVIRRIWRTINRCAVLRAQAPPERMQASDRVELKTFVIEGAWSGSPSTAADYPAYIVVLNETDKMRVRRLDKRRDLAEQSTAAKEADFRKLMADRCKGFGPGAKLIQISTPTLKGASWIETERLAGDNRRRLVPCPHCGHFQVLRTGDGKEPGGIKFAKLNGRLNSLKARDTAYYECEQCRGKITEDQRPEILQAGLWVPEGCHVNKRGKIAGAPARPGPHASFGPLSTLHSLLPGVSIGRYAQEYVETLLAPNRREARRHFSNSWESETWDPTPPSVRPHDIVVRMGSPEPMRICPSWSVFLTEGVDVGQIGNEYLFYWWVSAWGPHGRGHCVDVGVTIGMEEFSARILSCVYQRSGGGQLRPVLRLIDSSFFTQSIYEFCAKIPGCTPVKGSSGVDEQPLPATPFIDMYQLGFQSAGHDPKLTAARRALAAADLVIPNTSRSQGWVEMRLSGEVKRDAPDWYSIPEEILTGEALPGIDVIEQMLGDYKDEKGRWLKRVARQDLRDAWRYSMVAAWIKTKNGRQWDRIIRGDAPAIAKEQSIEQALAAAAVRAVGGPQPQLRPGG